MTPTSGRKDWKIDQLDSESPLANLRKCFSLLSVSMVSIRNNMAADSSSNPIDKGFAWVILLACSMNRMLIDGFWVSLGIFYVEWKDRFDASATNIAWIGFAFMLVLYIGGTIASALGHKLTYKVVTIFGGVLTSVSLFILSFAAQLWHVYLVIPFCGFGMGMAYQHGFSFYVFYFDKRYALATLLNGAASGVALFIIPPLLETLNDKYGTSGALQISSAFMMNICICGMISKHPTWEIHRTSQQEEIVDEYKKLNLNDKTQKNTAKSTESYKKGRTLLKKILKDISKSLNISVFRKVRIIFHAVVTPFLYGGAMVVFVYMVPYGIEAGISALKSSFLISVSGICIVIVRLSPIGHMVDKKIISASLLGGIGAVFGGFVMMAFPFTTTYFQMVLVCIVFGGVVCAISGAMYPVLVRDAAGSAKKASGALAYSNLVFGIGGITANLLTGFLRDLTDNYIAAYILCGIYFVLMGLSMLCDPYLIKWQANIDRRKNKTKTVWV